jgi:phosphoribosylanthranilate isomerase
VDVEIKFCGLTRADDAAEAERLGATYVGVIFAGGPRRLAPEAARSVHAAAAPHVRRVGVFGADSADRLAAAALDLGLDVIQLHGDPAARDVEALRGVFGGAVWAVARVTGDRLPAVTAELFEVADAVVLDARVDGAIGGTGLPLPWADLAEQVGRAREGHRARLAVAGGLRPSNVASAIAALSPDIVDVSSGVESAPGVKDHQLMRAFARAVRGRGGGT